MNDFLQVFTAARLPEPEIRAYGPDMRIDFGYGIAADAMTDGPHLLLWDAEGNRKTAATLTDAGAVLAPDFFELLMRAILE